MLKKLETINDKFNKINNELLDPNIVNDNKRFQSLMKERASLEKICEYYETYKSLLEELEEMNQILDEGKDKDLVEVAKEEKPIIQEKIEKLEEEIKLELIPKDPNDDKNIILEVRAGTGGDEASIFAGDLLKMYQKYAEKNKWKVEIMSLQTQERGGYKEAVLLISGKSVYSKMKFESGVHRVQRIPDTEANGRIHTSAATVAVLPEADEVDVEINPLELKIDVFRSSGPGGQSVNTTDSAVRVTHIPTGIVISCQDEKSQLKNKSKALKILRSKLYDLELQKQQQKMSQDRKSQVGTGDRSEKIRTYNFPQARVTDHRIKVTTYRLQEFMNGEIDEIVDSLIAYDKALKVTNS
jgi:peptide chain release factor 1